jgi:dolichyl-phosphate-mannose-protein mannosyltransferase
MDTDARTGVEEPPGVPAGTGSRRGAPSWWPRPLVLILAATALAGGLRFWHLSSPHDYVFDEVYYAKDACLDAGYPFRECGLESDAEQTFGVHPPLGREILSVGVNLFGNRPFGWRVASAVFGTLSVLLTAILAYLLFGGGWGGVAGLLLATEALNFVQSRLAMLDILLTTFVVAGFLFLVLDRRWADRRTTPVFATVRPEAGPPAEARPDLIFSPVFRPWRFAAGVAFGAAVATKWSAVPALLGAIGLGLAWEVGRRKDARAERPVWEAIRDESFGLFLFLVIVPGAVYLASYTRYFVEEGFSLFKWFEVQQGMARFSLELRATHAYSSRAWSWPLLIRPVAYYYKGGSNPSTSAEILGLGNPVIFWGFLLAVPWLVVDWIRRRDWRPGLILVAFASQYVPWFFVARTAFLFYMTPMTPFMVLGVTYGLRELWDVQSRSTDRVVRPFRALVVLLVLAAVGMFVFFFPVLTGWKFSYESWRLRMWFKTWI